MVGNCRRFLLFCFRNPLFLRPRLVFVRVHVVPRQPFLRGRDERQHEDDPVLLLLGVGGVPHEGPEIEIALEVPGGHPSVSLHVALDRRAHVVERPHRLLVLGRAAERRCPFLVPESPFPRHADVFPAAVGDDFPDVAEPFVEALELRGGAAGSLADEELDVVEGIHHEQNAVPGGAVGGIGPGMPGLPRDSSAVSPSPLLVLAEEDLVVPDRASECLALGESEGGRDEAVAEVERRLDADPEARGFGLERHLLGLAADEVEPFEQRHLHPRKRGPRRGGEDLPAGQASPPLRAFLPLAVPFHGVEPASRAGDPPPGRRGELIERFGESGGLQLGDNLISQLQELVVRKTFEHFLEHGREKAFRQPAALRHNRQKTPKESRVA
jgi:hypothetical protein